MWQGSQNVLFPFFTTEMISVVKIHRPSTPMRRYTPGERLWHTPDIDDYHASTPLTEGPPLCPYALSPLVPFPSRPRGWPMLPFPKAIPLSPCGITSARFSRMRILPRCFRRVAPHI